MPKITKRLVESAKVRDKDYIIFDSEIPGFGARILPSGKRSYLVQYRIGRKFRRMSLGLHGILTTERARVEAIKILGQVNDGGDPAGDREKARNELTVHELCSRVIDEHAAHHCKPGTVVGYRYIVKAYIRGRIGYIRVGDVERSDIAKFHHDLRTAPVQANRCIQFLSKAFNLAEVWGLRPDGTNPCRHIQKYPEKKRERYLTKDELARLGEVLRQCEHKGIESQSAINALRLLIFTGCRLSEIMTLKWDYVNFEGSALHLPDSKTGAKTVHIGAAAIQVLSKIERVEDNPWVITGKNPGAHLTDLQPPWRRIRKRANIADVRIHDLRHTFASTAVSAGHGLPMIGKLLGHTQVQTTARYAHLAAAPVKHAANAVAESLRDALS
ncbi:MAG: site-specific integrase [Gammaproteobacteria bacterium]